MESVGWSSIRRKVYLCLLAAAGINALAARRTRWLWRIAAGLPLAGALCVVIGLGAAGDSGGEMPMIFRQGLWVALAGAALVVAGWLTSMVRALIAGRLGAGFSVPSADLKESRNGARPAPTGGTLR